MSVTTQFPITQSTVGGDDASVDASSPPSVNTDSANSRGELEDQIFRAAALMHRSRHDLLVALTAFDRAGLWVKGGAVTCAHWAAERLDVSVATAREWLRVGHALSVLPDVALAYSDRRLSYSKVRAVTRVAVDHPGSQHELIELISGLPAGETGAALAGWCDDNENPEEREARQRRSTHLSMHVQPDGMGVMTIRLPLLLMGRLKAAIDTRVRQGGLATTVERPSLGHQRAHALVDIAANSAGSRVDTEIIVHVRGDGCSLHDGTPIADHAVAALIDSALIRALVHDADDRPINVSGRQRHPTDRQKRVVDERSPRCPDCGTRELLEYDHVPPFETTGHTVIDELRRPCARCHRLRHAEPPERGGGSTPSSDRPSVEPASPGG